MTGARRAITALALVVTLAGGAAAQSTSVSDAESFLTAVREQNTNQVLSLYDKKGAVVINYRGYDGSTPLTTAMQLRAGPFVNYLLGRNADPDLGGKNGDTPLIIAARIGYMDGILAILGVGGKVDSTNKQGETALIVAVQNRQPLIVRRLLQAGADANRTDIASGLSAKDYARRDTRSPEMLRMMDTTKKQAPIVGGKIF